MTPFGNLNIFGLLHIVIGILMKKNNSICSVVKNLLRCIFQHQFALKRKNYGAMSVRDTYSLRHCGAHTGGTLILQFLSFGMIIIFPQLTVNRI